jgi:ABC-2 type transport system permease protein
MRWHRIIAVVCRHSYEARRNFNRVTETLYWPIQNIFLWGFLTHYLVHHDGLKSTLGIDLVAAAILWGMFNAFQRDLAMGFMEELWARNLLNLFSTPLSISEYIAGLLLLTSIKAALGFSLAALIAWSCYAFNIFPLMPHFLPPFFNLIFFSFSIGLFITGLMVRYSAKVSTLAWSFAGILMPVSCVFYPLSALPDWLRPVAWALPTTQSFEAMRLLILHRQFSFDYFEWGFLLNLVYFGLAVAAFSYLFASARAKGFLVKQM